MLAFSFSLIAVLCCIAMVGAAVVKINAPHYARAEDPVRHKMYVSY